MEGMLVSTRDPNGKVISYADALLEGLAPDGGLYVPTEYPKISLEELSELKGRYYKEIAFQIKRKFVGDSIPEDVLRNLIDNAYSSNKFPVSEGNITPVFDAGDGVFIQNLSLGPTAAFKDMALQQLGQEMNYELNKRGENLVILGATSGDTGSSAEAAVKGLDRIKLFMLSPTEGMSSFQKAQMGELSGGNIHNISVNARFDDCQDLVKKLKCEEEFSKLGAVNSINWGRISSQVPYYVSGYLQVANKIGDPVDFTVPTGNFGNILAGYVARKMGLPIRRLIVATNENDVLATLMKTGIYSLTPAKVTSSPSMDISKASNYERLVFDLLGRNPLETARYMKEFEKKGVVDLKDFGLDESIFRNNNFGYGTSIHEYRIGTIQEIYHSRGYIIDTHTADAVIIAAALREKGVPMVAMQTALAVKFEDTIKEAIGFIPEREKRFVALEKRVKDGAFHVINPNSEELKSYLRANLN